MFDDDAVFLSLDSEPLSVIDETHRIRAEARLEQIVSAAPAPVAKRRWLSRKSLRWAAIPVAAAAAGAVAIIWPGSPSLTPARASFIACDSGVNANGESYGSMADVPTGPWTPESEPDLICAENSAGLVGFIRTEELRAVDGSNVANPEEALEWNAYRDSHQAPLLPLYEKDGVTVIGTWDGLDYGGSEIIEYVAP